MTEETISKVLSIVDSISQLSQSSDTEEVISPQKNTVKKVDTPRGLPKSRRFWKTKKERFSTINKTKGLQQNFQKKTALRLELKRTKDLSRQVQEDLKQKELARKERRRENIKRTEENKRKAEVVQVITNTAKLRRMKKKQLRFIQKRDTNKHVETSK